MGDKGRKDKAKTSKHKQSKQEQKSKKKENWFFRFAGSNFHSYFRLLMGEKPKEDFS